MDTVQFVMLIVVAAITGMASVLDEAQFHRPLIACTLVGLVLGDITTGIILGGTLELMALGWMNVGAAMAPDAALASVVATILVIVGHQDITAGIALAVPLAAAGQVLTIFVRTITVFFQHLADKFAEDGNSSSAGSTISSHSWSRRRRRARTARSSSMPRRWRQTRTTTSRASSHSSAAETGEKIS